MSASSDAGARMVSDSKNKTTKEGTVTDNWLRSETANMYKGKGNVHEYGNYEDLKLLH